MPKIPPPLERINLRSQSPGRPSPIGTQALIKAYGFANESQKAISRFLGNLSSNMASLASRFSQQAIQARAATQYNDAKAIATKGLTEWTDLIGDISPMDAADPNAAPQFSKYHDEWEKYQSNVYQNALSRITDPRARVDFDEWWTSAQDRSRIFTINHADQRESDYMRAAFRDRRDAYISGRDKQSLINDAENMVDSGIFTAQEIEQMLNVDTHTIDLANAEVDARGRGIDEGIAWLMTSPEANATYNITNDERFAIARDLEIEKAFTQDRINQAQAAARDETYWKAYTDIRDGKITNWKDLANEDLYPGLTNADQITFHNLMEEMAADKTRADAAMRQAQLDATLSAFDVKIINGTFTAEDLGWIQENAPDQLGDFHEKWVESLEDKQTGRINAMLSTKERERTLSETDIEWLQTAEINRPDLVEKWNNRLMQMRAAMQAEQASKKKTTKDLYEITDPQLEAKFYEMYYDNSISKEELTQWLRDNQGPDMANGTPRIGNDDFNKWMGSVQDREPIDEPVKTGYQIVTDFYDQALKDTDDPEERRRLIEEQARVLKSYDNQAFTKEDPVEYSNWLVDPPKRSWAQKRVEDVLSGVEKAVDAAGVIIGGITGTEPWERTFDLGHLYTTDEEFSLETEPKTKAIYTQLPTASGLENREVSRRLRDDPGSLYMSVGEYFTSRGLEAPTVDQDGNPIDPSSTLVGFTEDGYYIRYDKQGRPVKSKTPPRGY